MLQQPTSGITWKSYLSGFNCNWMNGKGCLLQLNPPFPPSLLLNPKQHLILLCVAPESQPWPPQRPLCLWGHRGSPYPFLTDTHTHQVMLTHARLPSPLDLLFWECDATDVSHTVGVLEYTRTRNNTQRCAQKRLCSKDNNDARRQLWVVRTMKVAVSLIGDKPGELAEVRWENAGKAWSVTTDASFYQLTLSC